MGNKTAKQLIQRAHEIRRYHHAYLILGATGIGKKSFAKLFAQGILCKSEQPPCGVCSSCKKVAHDTHPDFSVVLLPPDKTLMPIECIREIRSSCVLKPNEGTHRIYLIPQIQKLTPVAMAAFLKTLEEPPAQVIFLLTAPEKHVLPQTISSRMMAVSLAPLSDDMVEKALFSSFPNSSSADCAYATALAQGCLGQAMMLAIQGGKEQHFVAAEQFLHAIQQKNVYQMLRVTSAYEKDKEGMRLFLSALLALLRLALRKSVQQENMAGKLVEPLSSKSCEELIFLAEATLENLQANANMVLLASDFCRRTTVGNLRKL